MYEPLIKKSEKPVNNHKLSAHSS